MHMNYWLFKEEPTHYNFADLERDGKTTWSGVTNALALQNLRKAAKGDQVLYYHSGKEKAIVGVAEIVKAAYPDPAEKDEKLVVVDIKPVRRLARPVTLAEIKADKTFADWELVRISRLSVMPVSPAHWRRIEELSRSK
jgi:predicted RNA-binding protein with PUA-like domain